MGRGRAKAKQTKVARELKYSSGGTDLDRLRAELTSSTGNGHSDIVVTTDDDLDDDLGGDDDDDEDD